MQKLIPDSYPLVRPLFDAASLGLQPASILDGMSRGVVRVDRAATPRAGAIWDTLSSLYLAGDPSLAAFNAGWRVWVERTVMPAAREIGIPELEIHAAPEAWYQRLPALLAPHPVEPLRRLSFTFGGPRIRQPEAPPGYRLEPLRAALLARGELDGMDWLHGWILSFWHTLEAFLQHGVGACVLSQDAQVVSLCLSVFVSGSMMELGTGTREAHQGKGLSTAAAAACVLACVQRGLTPVWQCDASNLPSVAVARKVGFEPAGELTIRRVPLQEVTAL